VPAGIRIKETKEVYEGEVTELTSSEAENPLNGYGKTVSHVIVDLKSVKGTKHLRLDPSIYEAILKQKIVVGDVIYVEANTGAVKDACASSYDLESETYVPLSQGDVHKRKELVQDVSLGDLDSANARPQGSQDIMSVMGSLVKSGRSEVTDKLRREVNKVVKGYVDQGVAEVVPGVVFIDEVHMLDIDFVLATNRGQALVRGTTDMVSPHGIPVDLLDRRLIVKTDGYTREQVGRVVQVRANVEGVSDRMAAEGERGSLRYALQLLTPASILAALAGRSEIDVDDIAEMNGFIFGCKDNRHCAGASFLWMSTMRSAPLHYILEDGSGVYDDSDFGDMYDRLFLRIAESSRDAETSVLMIYDVGPDGGILAISTDTLLPVKILRGHQMIKDTLSDLFQRGPKLQSYLELYSEEEFRKGDAVGLCAHMSIMLTRNKILKKILTQHEVQAMLNLLRARLDLPLVREHKSRHRKALFQLSETSSLYPECLTLQGVERKKIPAGWGSYRDNENLVEFLKKNPDTYYVHLALDVALGLEHLRSREPSIVHGDLKGLNVFITHSRRACLVDFGLAFAIDTTVTVTQDSSANPGGTVRFQAPELINPQVRQGHNKATDISVRACVFYENSVLRSPNGHDSGTPRDAEGADAAPAFGQSKQKSEVRTMKYGPSLRLAGLKSQIIAPQLRMFQCGDALNSRGDSEEPKLSLTANDPLDQSMNIRDSVVEATHVDSLHVERTAVANSPLTYSAAAIRGHTSTPIANATTNVPNATKDESNARRASELKHVNRCPLAQHTPRLCIPFYVNVSCKYGSDCVHAHDYILEVEHLEKLREIGKDVRCKTILNSP
ncbi:hypothetical protein PILCRDRAFT_13465, partial [Piloderma croceum F 1598]